MVPPCPRCLKPAEVCVCDRAERRSTRARVLILQHPQEQDFLLGSARLVTSVLEASTLAIGLSWPSLAAALGHDAQPRDWAVLYPSSLPRPLTAEEKAAPWLLLDRHGTRRSPRGLEGIVVLDGTWSQAKSLWWRNPWLLRLNRLLLHPREPSIYGKLRQEPRREYLSTLESVAEALTGLGEPPETRAALRKLFRTMVQRARDYTHERRS